MRALGGGLSGAAAMVLQVLLLMVCIGIFIMFDPGSRMGADIELSRFVQS